MLPLIAFLVATSTLSPPAGPKSSSYSEADETDVVERAYDEEEEEEEYYEYDPRDPRYLPYDDEVPSGYVKGTRIRVGWLIAGVAVFVGLYAYTAFLFAVSDEGDELAFIPGVGPIIFAGRGTGSTFGDSILVVDGLIQMAAVAVAIWAVTDPRKLLIREDLAVTPFFSADGGGLGLTARF